jgi:hypothetical protein
MDIPISYMVIFASVNHHFGGSKPPKEHLLPGGNKITKNDFDRAADAEK